ncbi:MAG: hypothetical protein HY515_01310 [Candidatus Aenigmarchaeota archaeon]|nr:hypothetical protein [Candidatus Aenigmarchaeota archaeon]
MILDQERKRNLKIQERSGINIGLKDSFREVELVVPSQFGSVVETLKTCYKFGFRSLVVPQNVLAAPNNPKSLVSMSGLYKEIYTGLLQINRTAKKYRIELSFHADTMTILSPDDARKKELYREAVRVFCHASHILDGRLFGIKPGEARGMYDKEAVRAVVQELNIITDSLKVDTPIGIETMGKLTDIGSLNHILEIVKSTHQTEPLINFGAIHARGSGSLTSQLDIAKIFDEIESKLGAEYLKSPIMYFSTLSYGPSGETGSTTMAKSNLKFENIAKELINRGMQGTVIIDTPGKEIDALKCIKTIDENMK